MARYDISRLLSRPCGRPRQVWDINPPQRIILYAQRDLAKHWEWSLSGVNRHLARFAEGPNLREKPAGQLEDGSMKSPRSPIADFDTKIETLHDSAKELLKNVSKVVDENDEPKVYIIIPLRKKAVQNKVEY